MKHLFSGLLLFVSAIAVTPAGPQEDPQPIQRMAATERAFAAAAAEVGVRDAFLTFFAADAIEVGPGPVSGVARVGPAHPSLVARPLEKLPLATRLMWEPYTGQVSSDGTLGWLTGGYAALSLPLRTVATSGAYFSIWQRETDGTWKVWLDDGVRLPSVWQDASPFRVAPDPDSGSRGQPGETIDAAEQDAAGSETAWRERLAGEVRLHRQGQMPMTGRDAISEWAGNVSPRVVWNMAKTRIAASDDLAFTIGGYEAPTPAGSEHGTWVRVWKRDVTGRWRIVFETRKPIA